MRGGDKRKRRKRGESRGERIETEQRKRDEKSGVELRGEERRGEKKGKEWRGEERRKVELRGERK